MSFIVVGYYTEKYKQDAAEMMASCAAYGVPVYCEYVEDRGSWTLNTSYKPTFLLSCLERFNCDIVYVDVDARFNNFPELFNKLTTDIAYYKGKVWEYGDEEILSGTVFLRNNKIVHKFVFNWRNACNNKSWEWDQRLVAESVPEECTVDYLPIEYCAIFDSPMVNGKDIVIRHLQHSRITRQSSPGMSR